MSAGAIPREHHTGPMQSLSLPEDSAALVKWARLQSDRTATLEQSERWRECLEECDKGILRLADAESTALLEILVRIRGRRVKAARALRAAGEVVPPMPCPAAPEGETTVEQTKGPETEVGAPVPQTEEGYICPECNVPKRRDSEHFSPDPRSSDGLRKKCRQCQEAIQKAGWEKRRNGAAKPAGTPPAAPAPPAGPDLAAELERAHAANAELQQRLEAAVGENSRMAEALSRVNGWLSDIVGNAGEDMGIEARFDLVRQQLANAREECGRLHDQATDLAHALRVIVDPEDEEHFNPEGSLARVREWKELLGKCSALVAVYDGRPMDAHITIRAIGNLLGVPVAILEEPAAAPAEPSSQTAASPLARGMQAAAQGLQRAAEGVVAPPPRLASALDGTAPEALAVSIGDTIRRLPKAGKGERRRTSALAADAIWVLIQLGHDDLVAEAVATALEDLAGKAGE